MGGQEPGSTLDRIVKDKEGVKKRLEEEEKSFMGKKREYERKMIEFEKQEVSRREQETNEATGESVISCLNDKLSEVQRSLNQRVQNFEDEDSFPSAPHEVDGEDEDDDGGSG